MNDHGEHDLTITFSDGTEDMEFTGERYVPGVSGQIQFEHLHRYLLAVKYAAKRDILDIACGEGYGAAALAHSGRTVLGVDIAADAIAHATARYRADNLRFAQGSITAIPAEDASCDMAVCFETLEHVAEQEQVMRELRRVLRPDGMLLISTPNRNAGDGAWHEQNPFHQKELSQIEFQTLLSATFRNVALMEQRFVHGSIVSSESERNGPAQLVMSKDLVEFKVSEGSIGRYYFLAMASDAELPAPPHLSVFDGLHDLQRWQDQFAFSVTKMHTQEQEIVGLQEQLRQAKIRAELQNIQIDFLRKKLLRSDQAG